MRWPCTQGLIHRDVKPSNILLDEGVERALLTDFGLARAEDDAALTRSGFHPGTPHYMSPEQVRGEAIDARSDLFSLGCVLYALCTGHPPFRAETSYAVLRRITDDTARPIRELNPDVPEWLERIVMKLLSKSPADRFDSADDVADVLEDCLAHVQHPTTSPLPESIAAMSSRFRNRPPLGKFTAAAAFAFSIIISGVLIVLELNKGTLTIESDADDVPIRIMQGDDMVRKLTVTKGAESVRIAAGTYVVEVDGEFTDLSISGDSITLKRGANEIVRITKLLQQVEAKRNSVSGTLDEAGPIPLNRYVAQLPDGRSVEFVGITQNNDPVSEGWSPDGLSLGEVAEEWNADVLLGGDSRDFLFQLDGLKDVPSLRFSLPGRGAHFSFMQPEQLPGPWRLRVGGSLEKRPKPPGQFLRQEAGVVQVAFTDEAWGEWLQVSAADGSILNPQAETAEYNSKDDEFKIQGVAVLPEESMVYAATGFRAKTTVVLPASPGLTLFQTLRHSQMNDFRIRGIDSEGDEAWLTTVRIPRQSEGFPEERTWRLYKTLPDGRTLSHFEFRLRPYRHLVTFENVATDRPTDKPSKVNVSVESIGGAVEKVSETVDHPNSEGPARSDENHEPKHADARLSEIRSQAYTRLSSIRSLAYRFEVKDSEGWHSKCEFFAERVRFRLNREDVTAGELGGMMKMASAFDGTQQQTFDGPRDQLRLKTTIEGASYGVMIPQTYVYAWLLSGKDNHRWDTILDDQVWQQRFREANYIGEITEDGHTLDIVDFPQRINVATPCTFRVYFDRDLGFLPVRYFRQTVARNELSTTMKVTHHKAFTIDGKQIVIPLKVDFSETQADGVSWRGETTISVDEDSLRVNEPLDESLFTLSRTDGVDHIYDMDHDWKFQNVQGPVD
ncbi:serine/threonine-protein kinase [Fuerstiella marisgermanici]|uniref:Serine/threonine-protein kinase pkn5 n=1 Tax=Fuerstiella marisgermanici TaxID=1891926 RepID=A0A1P8WM72_9PLAN|nr:serine/threonine-protein kinase [Fuerstiella marisgermanici]APZ95141.1 Serine/threonine-protein kinase pkn5 [Fuerstiella marisgermanici]